MHEVIHTQKVCHLTQFIHHWFVYAPRPCWLQEGLKWICGKENLVCLLKEKQVNAYMCKLRISNCPHHRSSLLLQNWFGSIIDGKLLMQNNWLIIIYIKCNYVFIHVCTILNVIGIDVGGVSREFFTCLCDTIFGGRNPHGLFTRFSDDPQGLVSIVNLELWMYILCKSNEKFSSPN